MHVNESGIIVYGGKIQHIFKMCTAVIIYIHQQFPVEFILALLQGKQGHLPRMTRIPKLPGLPTNLSAVTLLWSVDGGKSTQRDVH